MNYKSFLTLLLLLVVGAACCTAAAKEHPAITDDSLTDNVRRKLTNDDIVKGGAFDVDVKNGVVTLRGKVEQDKQKERATKLVRKVKGVKNVDNQLTVVGKGGR